MSSTSLTRMHVPRMHGRPQRLGIQNIYSMAQRYKAEDRWCGLHQRAQSGRDAPEDSPIGFIKLADRDVAVQYHPLVSSLKYVWREISDRLRPERINERAAPKRDVLEEQRGLSDGYCFVDRNEYDIQSLIEKSFQGRGAERRLGRYLRRWNQPPRSTNSGSCESRRTWPGFSTPRGESRQSRRRERGHVAGG